MIKKCQRNTIQYGSKLKVCLRRNLVVDQRIMINTLKHDKYISYYILYTNFRYNKIPKDIEYCTCLSVILVDSFLVNSDKEYYPQMFLEECKYAIKNRKINKYN